MRALFYTAVARIRDFLRPAAGDADFDQELELHLAMAEEDKVRGGLSPEQARREARLELGGVAQLREAARAARGLPWLETFWLDSKLGVAHAAQLMGTDAGRRTGDGGHHRTWRFDVHDLGDGVRDHAAAG